ncbi:hypothetical protein [Prosthecobacter sp.]|uniref:hypothetical protein n=1 Tax=Prosthecobacter sp. TaxID=1965333 RepID=UPI0037844B41
MISAFNRSQIVWGILGLVGSALCYALAWLFFRYGSSMALDSFGYSTAAAPWIAAAALVAITLTGWRKWQNGQGFQSFSESALFSNFGAMGDAANAYVVDHYANQVTGPAHVLSQIFLGGPLFLFRSLHRLRLRFPHEEGLEEKLARMLALLHAANKWQGLADYPGQEREILLLNLMKKIEFSKHKGNVRFKTKTSHGI